MKKIFNFFDRLEDKVRHTLSKTPNIYAFISGIGVVLFFRGVWMIADTSPYLHHRPYAGLLTLGISVFILLITGTLVSHHLQTDVIISGLKKEKRIEEKSLAEIKTVEENKTRDIQEIKRDIAEIKQTLKNLEGGIK